MRPRRADPEQVLKEYPVSSGLRSVDEPIAAMPMSQSDLEASLREAFPDAEILVEDLAGDGDHYRARIVSSSFRGLSRVAQHQLVHEALKGRVGGELHALALQTAPRPED
jgi:stress-induced morphogen